MRVPFRACWFVFTAFVCLRDPQNEGIWIVLSQVVSVLHPVGCAPGSGARIVTSAGPLCVRETPQEVMKLIEKAKEDK
jgi:hypothetical protein